MLLLILYIYIYILNVFKITNIFYDLFLVEQMKIIIK